MMKRKSAPSVAWDGKEELRSRKSTRKNKLPWEGKRSDKKTEQFNLRLSECELEKLRFISANTPLSMQSFIRNVLTTAIDRKVKAILEASPPTTS